jgi:hypothetical protein
MREVVPRSSHVDFSRAPAGIAGYIGDGGAFMPMVAFADAYADQSQHDPARLVEPITDGVIPAEEGI